MSNASWHHAQLRRFLVDHAREPDTESLAVHLTNPDEEAELDTIILDIWPHAMRPLRDGSLAVHIEPGDSSPAAAVRTLRTGRYITRSITFLIEDTARPLRGDCAPPWFCRFRIDVTRLGYMLRKTTILSFPATFDLRRLARFLREPLMAGCPPSLGYRHEGARASDAYEVRLDTGDGTGWGVRSTTDAADHVHTAVHDHVAITRAMDQLAADWNDPRAFDELYAAAISANVAC